jgi:hypothetical protein
MAVRFKKVRNALTFEGFGLHTHYALLRVTQTLGIEFGFFPNMLAVSLK